MFLPPVGESPLLSFETDGTVIELRFLPPVGESPLLRNATYGFLCGGIKFLPPVGESPLLRMIKSQERKAKGFYPLSGNHLY